MVTFLLFNGMSTFSVVAVETNVIYVVFYIGLRTKECGTFVVFFGSKIVVMVLLKRAELYNLFHCFLSEQKSTKQGWHLRDDLSETPGPRCFLQRSNGQKNKGEEQTHGGEGSSLLGNSS